MDVVAGVGVLVNADTKAAGDFLKAGLDLLSVLGVEERELALRLLCSECDVQREFGSEGALGFASTFF